MKELQTRVSILDVQRLVGRFLRSVRVVERSADAIQAILASGFRRCDLGPMEFNGLVRQSTLSKIE